MHTVVHHAVTAYLFSEIIISIQVFLCALSGPTAAYLWMWPVVIGPHEIQGSCNAAFRHVVFLPQDALRSVAIFMACEDVEIAVCCWIVCWPALQNHHSIKNNIKINTFDLMPFLQTYALHYKTFIGTPVIKCKILIKL